MGAIPQQPPGGSRQSSRTQHRSTSVIRSNRRAIEDPELRICGDGRYIGKRPSNAESVAPAAQRNRTVQPGWLERPCLTTSELPGGASTSSSPGVPGPGDDEAPEAPVRLFVVNHRCHLACGPCDFWPAGRVLRAMATEDTRSDGSITNTRWKSKASRTVLPTIPVDNPPQLRPLMAQMIAKSHDSPPLRVV